jgi:hypothetical protein
MLELLGRELRFTASSSARDDKVAPHMNKPNSTIPKKIGRTVCYLLMVGRIT